MAGKLPLRSNLERETIVIGTTTNRHVVLFDSECGLCSRWVQQVIKRDKQRLFSFASTKGRYAAGVERRHSIDIPSLKSMVIVFNAGSLGESLKTKSNGVAEVCRNLPGLKLLGWFILAWPLPIRDRVYGFISKHRLKLFGRADVCALATPSTAALFLD